MMVKTIKFFFWNKCSELTFHLRENWLDKLQTFCDDRASKNDPFS
jgi:hypothetical protein